MSHSSRPYSGSEPTPRDHELLNHGFGWTGRDLSVWAAHRSAVSQAFAAGSAATTAPTNRRATAPRWWGALLGRTLHRRSTRQPQVAGISPTESALGPRATSSVLLQHLPGLGIGEAERGVVSDDRWSIEEMFEIRAVFDGMAAEAVAQRRADGQITAAALQRLWALAETTDQATRAGELPQAAAGNRTFHQAIASLAGNTRVVELLDRLWDQIQVVTQSCMDDPDRIAGLHAEHQMVLTRIAEGDPAGAFTLAREHALATIGAGGRTTGGAG